MTRKLSKPLLAVIAGLTALTGAGLELAQSGTGSGTVMVQRTAPVAIGVMPDTLPADVPAAAVAAGTPATGVPSALGDSLRLVKQLVLSGNEEELFQLKTLLGNPDSALGLTVARQLLEDPDPRFRMAGVDILTNRSLTEPVVHDEVIRLLHQETDTNVLTRLLNSLDAPIDSYGKDQDMSAALHRLLAHTDADVRSQAVLQMLQWDDYPTLEGYLYQALNDPSSEVRLSAATVVSLIDTRSTTLRSALVGLRNNPQETRDMRESIDAALTRIDDYNQENAGYH